MAKLTSEQIYGMGVKWVKKDTYTYKGKTYHSYNDMYRDVEADYNAQNKSSSNQSSNALSGNALNTRLLAPKITSSPFTNNASKSDPVAVKLINDRAREDMKSRTSGGSAPSSFSSTVNISPTKTNTKQTSAPTYKSNIPDFLLRKEPTAADYEKDVFRLEGEITQLDKDLRQLRGGGVAPEQSNLNEYNDKLNKLYSKRSELNSTKAKMNVAKYREAGASLSTEIKKDSKYNEYVAKGEALGNEKADGWFVPDTQRKNTVAYLRNNPEAMKMYEDALDSTNGLVKRTMLEGNAEYKLAKYGTQEQVETYYAYLGKGDTENAEKYLKYVEENLNITMGNEIAEGKDSILSKLAFGVTAGSDQFQQGMANIVKGVHGDEYIPASPTQVASSKVRESLKYKGPEILGASLGQGAYDFITTTSNMAPSIGASFLANAIVPGSGAVVGSSLMGGSAAGNSYQEKLNAGWTKGQAATYATIVGVSEAGLQYAMGGVGSLGGKLTGTSAQAIARGIDNAALRFAATYGMKMASEGMEEALQEVLNPFFENIALGYKKNKWSDIDWEQVAYSGMLGALSAGFLEGGSTAVNVFGENNSANKYGKSLKDGGYAERILEIAATSTEGSEAKGLYETYAKKGVNADNITDLQLGRLFVNAEADARNTLSNVKNNPEQEKMALSTILELDAMKSAPTIETVEQGVNEVAGNDVAKISETTPEAQTVTSKPSEATSVPETLEQAATETVESRKKNSGKMTAKKLDALTRDNQPIYVEEVKAVTKLGDKGAELITKLANQNGVTFTQAKNAVQTAYEFGLTGVDKKTAQPNLITQTQNAAFEAGRIDRGVQDAVKLAESKNATIYDGAFTENEYTKNFTKAEKKMIATVAKLLRMDVSAVDKIIASETYDNFGNKIEHEANAEHNDGKMVISDNRSASALVYKMVLHEGGHRMGQFATKEWGVLMNALYQRAEQRNLSRVSQFESVKAEHDNAGIEDMNTIDYIEEVAVRELETIFSSAEEFNKWYAEISGNAELKGNWQKFCNWISEIIEEIKRAWSQRNMSAGEKAAVREQIAELERIRGLYAETLKASEKAAESIAKQKAEKSSESLENQGNKSFSLKEIIDENGKSYGIGVVLDSTLLDNLTPEERVAMVKEYVKELGGNTFTAFDGNGKSVDIRIAKANERFRNSKGNKVPVNRDLTSYLGNNKTKQEAITLIDELIISANITNTEPSRYSHGWLDDNGKNDWDYWTTYIQDKNNTIWEAILNIANSSNGEKILYDIFPIKKVGQSVTSDTSTTNDSVPQNSKSVKGSFSLKDNNQRLSPIAMENRINELREEMSNIEDELVFSDDADEKKLNNRLVKLQYELDNLIAEERKAAVKTTLPKILDNLSKYRLSDLHSLAEQVSDGAWDNYEDLSRDELESELRESIESRMADLSPEEQNEKRFGFSVRPVGDNVVKVDFGANKALDNVGVQFDEKSKSVAPSSFSLKTWNASTYVQDRETAIKAIVKATGVSKKSAERYIDNINSIARLIADDRTRLDYDSNLDDSATVLKSNSEYKWTVDMSTLCAKRLLTTGTFDAIQKALPNTVFDSDDIVNLRSMLLGKGYEVACGICYVESTRRELGPITAEFIERYKESQKSGKPITRINSEGKVVELTKTQEQMETTKDKSSSKFFADKNYTPTLAELNTTDIDKVKVEHPLVYEAYLNFMNARGQAKPKLLETRAEYKGEILKHFKTATARNARNRAGGLRVQSFSDFEVAHLIDMMQIVLDMSQVGLKSQAYTKVPAFADVFGGTGMKINLSLIAKDSGLDKNGNLIFDDVEGMPHEEAFRLRNKYSKNVGTILVGKSDAHIIAAMADPRIDFIIPFHKSSWKESLYDALGLTGYDDYTSFQNEKPIDKDREIKNYQPSEYWDYSKTGEENAKTYLEMCKEDGRIPKFPQFQNYEGYWKLLIDFKMYDNNGVGSPQTVVAPKFDMNSANDILNSYEGGHRALPVAQDVVDDFVEQYKNKGASFSLKRDANLSNKDTKELLDIIEHLKGEFEVTKFAKADPKKLAKMTKDLLKEYSSQADLDKTTKAIDELYQYLANGEDGHPAAWNEVYSKAYEIAENIINNALVVDDELYTTYKGLREYLRKTPIKFDSEYDSVPSGYDNYQDFRRRNWGRFNFTKNGTSIDKVYQELSDLYPEFFNSEEQINPQDQFERIVEVLDEIQPAEVNPHSSDMQQMTAQVANDIIDRFFDVPQAKPTFADKAERRVVEARIAGGKKVEAVRVKKDEKIQKLIEKQRAKTKQLIEKAKTKKTEAVNKEKAKREKAISNMKESQKAKVLRAQIMRHANDLSQKLVRPSDNKHIPEDLKGLVAKVLESINLESNYTYDPVSRSYKKSDDGLPTKRTKAFEELRKLYKEISSSVVVDPDLLGEDGLLSDVILLADKRVVDMNSTELQTVWKTICAVEASISTANKMFSAGKYETIFEVAEKLWNDNNGKKGKYYDGLKKSLKIDMLTPETFFHYLGDAGDSMFRMMRDAQDKHISIMKEVADFTHKNLKDVNVDSLEKTIHTVTLGGEEVKLSTAQLMELYVLVKREQAIDHIFKGGVLPDVIAKKKKLTRAEPIRNISMAEISGALANLTDDQKKIADKLQRYVSSVLSEYGNEASMQVYNYRKFNEQNYWTIRTNKQEIQSNIEKDTAVTSVANKGMTKATKPHANTSVRIGSIFDTFSSHSSDMATYAAWLGTSEDINRIRNFVFWNDNARVGTVKGILDTVHGTQGSKYLEKLLTDVSIGVHGIDNMNPFKNLIGTYKAASVGANIRVIIQQPTAILRAMDMIGAQHLTAGAYRPLKGWEKAKKYAPIAQWKDWGYFDINTGRQMKDILFDNASVLEKTKQIGMMGASMADSLAWGQLWNAVESETKAKHKELEVGSEEFYEAVAKRFTEIVDHTQVVDGILQRSQAMRDTDGIAKMATSFMGEPTKQYNMAISAAHDAKNSKGEARNKAYAKLGRASMSLAVAGIVNACAQSIIDAMRDDDKEEKYWEKWLDAFIGSEDDKWFQKFGNLGDTFNPLTYVPYAKDILSVIQGYDVKRMDMESISKVWSATENLYKAITKTGKYTLAEASASFFAEIGRLFGVPVANVKRDIKSAVMTYAIETDNYLMQYRMEKAMLDINYSYNNKNFVDILFNAYNNDSEAYEIIYNDMLKSGYDVDKIKSGMESRMKKAEGVEKSSELEKRYMTPETEKKYDNSLKRIQSSQVWKSASPTQRKEAEADLHSFLTSDSDSMEKLRAEARASGVDETEYTLWQLAIEMADQPDGQKGSGSYDLKEKAEAINSLDLGDKEIAYFFGKGLNASSKEELDETLNAGIDLKEYVNFKAATSDMKADKNAKGNSIPNSKKKKVVNYLNNAGLTDEEWDYFYYEIMNYKK